MSGLTWLHLSDWHHKDFRIDPEVVRDRLVKDIEERTAISPDLAKIDFIVFSGDAASTGLAEEYNEAKTEFFDRILKAAGDVSPRRLFIVPGNHDLDENQIRKLPDDFQKDAVSKEDVDIWLPDATKRDILLRPFRDFKSFVTDYTGQDSPDFSNVQTWKIEGKVVSLLGINSAWWCRRHKDVAGGQNDYGFVMVGEQQIHEPLDKISQSDLRIAVLHHSQDWLEYFDGKQVWSRLRQECNFILHGHGHEPKVTAEHGTGGDCVIIPAGAAFERRIAKDPSHINSYNFVHLNLETGKGTVFLRRWIDERTKWARDDQTYLDGEFPFNLHGAVDDLKGSSVSSSVPHQIPPPSRDFTGRDEEIQILLDGFDGGVMITGLRGMGGVGKTALAYILAERLVEHYPDGQILVEMKGTDKKPLSMAEAMAQVIRAYDPESKMIESEAELKGRYFSILHGKKALILLDNAASRVQVEPLIPPAGSAILITSRNKFALPGLKEKDLDVLSPEDAKNLLLEICRRIGVHAEEMAKLCGCLPLALRNAAYALKEKPNLSVANYIKRLGDARKRLELVEASFDLSYQLLTLELQKLWSLLSVFPADFDRAGAAAVWVKEQIPAEDALGELVKWSLVDFLPSATSDGGRYRLHNLARDFADSQLEPSARNIAKFDHARHYQELLWKANDLLLQGGYNFLKGLDLFDSDWINIQIGQSWIEANAAKSPENAKICSNFAKAWEILDLRLHPSKYIKWLNSALEAARQIKEDESEGHHLLDLGLAHDNMGEYHEAIKFYEMALEIDRKIVNRNGEGKVLNGMGLAYYSLGDTRKAIEYYEQALKISRKLGDRRSEEINLGNLGVAYIDLGEPKKAIEYYEQALKISCENGDRRNQRINLVNLGYAYSDLGEYEKAFKYNGQAHKISREIGDQRSEENIYSTRVSR